MSLNHIVAFYTYRDVLTPGGKNTSTKPENTSSLYPITRHK